MSFDCKTLMKNCFIKPDRRNIDKFTKFLKCYIKPKYTHELYDDISSIIMNFYDQIYILSCMNSESLLGNSFAFYSLQLEYNSMIYVSRTTTLIINPGQNSLYELKRDQVEMKLLAKFDNNYQICGISNDTFGGIRDEKEKKLLWIFDKHNKITKFFAMGNKSYFKDFLSGDFVEKDDDKLIDVAVLNKVFAKIMITKITTGFNHILFLSSDGYVWSNGSNYYGQCGLDVNTAQISTVYLITTLTDVSDIESGENHNICLTKNGKCMGFGRNSYFNLGLGFKSRAVSIPIELEIDQKIVNGACGDNNTAVITQNGKAYLCGYGSNGECGNGSAMRGNRIKQPICINELYDDLNNIHFESVTCGRQHTIITSKKRDVYTFGCDSERKCRLADDVDDVVYDKKKHHIIQPYKVKGIHKHKDSVLSTIAADYMTCVLTRDIFQW